MSESNAVDSTVVDAIRRSPLDAEHTAAGAAFTTFAGWRMPLKYTSELAEHAAVRTAAGLFDLSHMGEIVVLGHDAVAALDAALLSDFGAVAVGRAKYSVLLADDGGILDDLVVYRTGDDRFLVVANAANRQLVADALRERAIGFQVEVQDESDDIGLLALQGPRALDVLNELDGFAADDADRTRAHFTGALAGLKNYRFLSAWYSGHPVIVARTGYTGEVGFELFAAPALLPELWAAILEAGAGSGVVPVGLAARDTLRLEAGMPLHGNELSAHIRPAQAGLGRLIPTAKASDYIGKRAVEQVHAGDRVLVGLVSAGRRAGRAGYPVLHDGSAVGVVTSGALSPSLGHPIAMAYVDPASASPGTELTIDVRGTALPATVTALPFYRRKA